MILRMCEANTESGLTCTLPFAHQGDHVFPDTCAHEGYESNFKFDLDDAGDGEQFSATRIYQCPKCKELVVVR